MKSVVAIIVNYNSGHWLEQCINALLNSKYPVDIFIVDNASTDDSLVPVKLLVDQNSNLHLLENQQNLGFATANNLILNTTDADYYVLINPDCLVEPETIGYLVNLMNQDHQVGLAGTRILNEDGSQQKTSKRRFPTPENSFFRVLGLSHLVKGNAKLADFDMGDVADEGEKEFVEAISGAFMVVNSEALKQVGGLDEGYFMHCEDLDWCKRIWLHGFKVAYYPGTSVIHGKGKSSQGNPYRVNWYLHKGMLRFYRKFYRKHYGHVISGIVYMGVITRLGLTNFKIFIKRLSAG